MGLKSHRKLAAAGIISLTLSVCLIYRASRSDGGEEQATLIPADVAAEDEKAAQSLISDTPDLPEVARVREWVADERLGSFVVIEILQPDKVSQDSILSVYRDDMLLGELRVFETEDNTGIAQPIEPFPETPLTPVDSIVVSGKQR